MTKNNTPGVNDHELLGRVVKCKRLATKSRHGSKRWVVIMNRFMVGSTYAQALCIRFGFDPDEKVRR